MDTENLIVRSVFFDDDIDRAVALHAKWAVCLSESHCSAQKQRRYSTYVIGELVGFANSGQPRQSRQMTSMRKRKRRGRPDRERGTWVDDDHDHHTVLYDLRLLDAEEDWRIFRQMKEEERELG